MKFVVLHTDDPKGPQEVLVNLDNVLFIIPNRLGSCGSSIAFHAVEGHVAGDLWVMEKFVEIKQGYCR
jgi:hypothetical protein